MFIGKFRLQVRILLARIAVLYVPARRNGGNKIIRTFNEIKDKNTTNIADYMTDSRRYIREIKGGYMSIEFYYMMLMIALLLFVLEALDENMPGM